MEAHLVPSQHPVSHTPKVTQRKDEKCREESLRKPVRFVVVIGRDVRSKRRAAQNSEHYSVVRGSLWSYGKPTAHVDSCRKIPSFLCENASAISMPTPRSTMNTATVRTFQVDSGQAACSQSVNVIIPFHRRRRHQRTCLCGLGWSTPGVGIKWVDSLYRLETLLVEDFVDCSEPERNMTTVSGGALLYHAGIRQYSMRKDAVLLGCLGPAWQ